MTAKCGTCGERLLVPQEKAVAWSNLIIEVEKELTDIMPKGLDLANIKKWKKGKDIPKLTRLLMEERSIRVIPIEKSSIDVALNEFDNVINKIEGNVLSEMTGSNIKSAWPCNQRERTCTACDFKTFCPNPAPNRYYPTVP